MMNMLGLRETADKLAKANGVRWYRLVRRRQEDDVLRNALTFEVDGRRKTKEDLEKTGRGRNKER